MRGVVVLYLEPLEGRLLFSGVDLSPENSDAFNLIKLNSLHSDPRYSFLDGSGVSVAVIDTGTDVDSDFFRPGEVVYQYDFANNDSDASDTEGHGTNISSLIGSNNSTYPGVAPGVNLIVLKVFPDGSAGASSEAITQALQWCVDNATRYNIAAVNMSLGSGDFSSNYSGEYSTLFSELVGENVLPIAAAGNDYYASQNNPGIAYPAADANAISVGAVWAKNAGGPFTFLSGAQDNTTGPDRIVSFSQRDPGLIDIFAPGTLLEGAAPNNTTAELSGTSQATAIVSGVAALADQLAMHELGRKLTFGEFQSLLQNTGATIHDGDDEDTNVTPTNADYKRVDAYALMQAISGMVPPEPQATLSAGNLDLAKREYTFTVNYSSPNGINAGTIDSSDVLVTGPDGFSQLATLVSVDQSGASRQATYAVTLNNDTGNYTLQLVDGQVRDDAGAAIPAETLGNFVIDSTPPTITITGGSVVEGNSGTSSLVFTVTLDRAVPQQVTVDYSTADGTATAGSDYDATTGVLTFLPGQMAATITVPVIGDTIAEPNEALTLNLTNAVGATIGTSFATGTIINDDADAELQGTGKKKNLVVHGTNGDDTILFTPATHNGIQCWINGTLMGTYFNIAKIIAYGGDGNDNIMVGSSIKIPAELHGDAGNDVLTGGRGNDLLIGGDGADILNGGPGNDTLVGSNMPDTLVSKATKLPKKIASARTMLSSVLDDGTTDRLTGSSGNDSFVYFSNDAIMDIGKGDKLLALGF